MKKNYDVIVVGGGHAGAEAASVAATMGASVLLITMDLNKIAQMSCNPAIGGIAKGQIVREIDALGGLSGLVTDETMIQFRMLNKSKGPAMWSPRAQSDRVRFSMAWRSRLENNRNVYFWQDTVTELVFEKSVLVGVKTRWSVVFYAKSIILTAGTFLNGLMHVGPNTVRGGRVGERASYHLTEQIFSLGIQTGRMKTGTPPRVDGRTIDFSRLEKQEADVKGGKFSFSNDSKQILPNICCYMAHTNKIVHETLKSGFDDSPLFSGTIKGIGPRYCPSIEDKLVTFASKDSHLLFVEPEGYDTIEYYINGFSSSLPLDVQLKALRQINGFENAEIFRPAYAIEYDFFQPTQLNHSLESKYIKNLYFAGQVNGTTGYEEAAAQGLVAGINAVLKQRNDKPFVLTRDSSYIGVLIDDLVTKGVDEPYRMFTSRAEFRILLRQDNADERLTPIAHELGTISDKRYNEFLDKQSSIQSLQDIINKIKFNKDDFNSSKLANKSSSLKETTLFSKLLLRPELNLQDLISNSSILSDFVKNNYITDEIISSTEIRIKYKSYIDRERQIADKISSLDKTPLPSSFNYELISSISTEARQKLMKIRPTTIGQAGRIPGISPSDINAILIYIGR